MNIAHEYTIALASTAHVPLLAAIEIAAASIFPAGSIPDHIRSDSVPQATLLEAVHKGQLWVALDKDTKPVGFSLVKVFDDAVLLAELDVHPDHMRKGIGSALIMQVVDYARLQQKTALYLTTFTHVPWNAPAYAKRGFVALKNDQAPPFLKKIIEEEKRNGLTQRTAMRLEQMNFEMKHI